MAKVIEKKVTITVELNQQEIDDLYNILDCYFADSIYKKMAGRLSLLRHELKKYANEDIPF